jgi:FlaG/FlaF family flagellin (archaellin)
MVAVTVILATTIGTYALGSVSDFDESEPLVIFEMSPDGTPVVLTHAGGETLDGENVYIVSESGGRLGNYAGTNGQACDTTISIVKAGTTCQISAAPSGGLYVVWRSAGRSAILSQERVSDDRAASTLTPTPTTPTSTPTVTPTATSTPSNTPPTADFTTDRKGASNNVDLDGAPSSDSDGSIVTYEWDIDADGSVERGGQTVKNAKIPKGTEVTLIITDDDGATDSITETVN